MLKMGWDGAKRQISTWTHARWLLLRQSSCRAVPGDGPCSLFRMRLCIFRAFLEHSSRAFNARRRVPSLYDMIWKTSLCRRQIVDSSLRWCLQIWNHLPGPKCQALDDPSCRLSHVQCSAGPQLGH